MKRNDLMNSTTAAGMSKFRTYGRSPVAAAIEAVELAALTEASIFEIFDVPAHLRAAAGAWQTYSAAAEELERPDVEAMLRWVSKLEYRDIPQSLEISPALWRRLIDDFPTVKADPYGVDRLYGLPVVMVEGLEGVWSVMPDGRREKIA